MLQHSVLNFKQLNISSVSIRGCLEIVAHAGTMITLEELLYLLNVMLPCKQEMVTQYKAQSSQQKHEDVDLDELMDVCNSYHNASVLFSDCSFSDPYSDL